MKKDIPVLLLTGYLGSGKTTVVNKINQTLVNTINTACSAIRHCSYDPVRDGFWLGDWSTLGLYSATGALIQNAPAPSSAYGSAYFMDDDMVEHLYLFTQPNSDAQVYDYNIANNTISSAPVFSFTNSLPGCTGIAGGAFVGEYGDKIAFFGNVQQSPNLIGIYELAEGTPGPGPGPTPLEGVLGYMISLRLWLDAHQPDQPLRL